MFTLRSAVSTIVPMKDTAVFSSRGAMSFMVSWVFIPSWGRSISPVPATGAANRTITLTSRRLVGFVVASRGSIGFVAASRVAVVTTPAGLPEAAAGAEVGVAGLAVAHLGTASL